MPRKVTTQPAPDTAQERSRPTGRASFPAPDGGLVLSSDFLVRHVVHDPYTEQAIVIVEGPGLPPWQRGQKPQHFNSPEAFAAYLQGDRSEVTAEPAG